MAPARIFISDDFPDPFTPMSPTRSPSSMTSVRSSKTVRLPKASDKEAARSRVTAPCHTPFGTVPAAIRTATARIPCARTERGKARGGRHDLLSRLGVARPGTRRHGARRAAYRGVRGDDFGESRPRRHHPERQLGNGHLHVRI